jgi:DNA-binding response OmpR family regulator
MTAHLSLNPTARIIKVNTTYRVIRHQPKAILWLLMCHKFVSRELITAVLWPQNCHLPDHFLTEIKVQIFRLRNNLAGSGWKIINERRLGYSLIKEGE